MKQLAAIFFIVLYAAMNIAAFNTIAECELLKQNMPQCKMVCKLKGDDATNSKKENCAQKQEKEKDCAGANCFMPCCLHSVEIERNPGLPQPLLMSLENRYAELYIHCSMISLDILSPPPDYA